MSAADGGSWKPQQIEPIDWSGHGIAADLRAENERLRKDAERYRWLVENSFDREGVPQLHVWLHTWEPHSQTGEPTEWKQRVRGPAIDRVVDTAMKQTPNSN